MKKIPIRIFAALLAFVIALMPLTVCAADASYPDGYTEADANTVIPAMKKLAADLLSENADMQNIGRTVYSSVCCDATVNSLFKTFYGEMTSDAEVLKLLGIDLSPAALAETFKKYSKVWYVVQGCKDLNEVVTKSDYFVWGITDRDSFSEAMATMFLPFGDVFYALLCGGKLGLNSLVSVSGGNGYEKAIVPILKNLGSPVILSQSEFTRSASKRENMMIRILSMVYSAVDILLADPVNGITDVLPKIAAYLNDGKLSDAINDILDPLTLNIGSISVPGLAKLLGNVINIEQSADISSMIGDIDLTEKIGKDVSLKLPEINLADFAACATSSGDTYKTDGNKSFMTLLYWLISAVKLNEGEIEKLLGGDEQMTKIISGLLKKTDKEIAGIIFFLFTKAGETSVHTGVTYAYPAVTPVPVAPPQGLSAENLQTVLDGIDPLITQILQETDKNATIEDTVKTAIYSNSILRSVSSALYGLFAESGVSQALGLLGISPVYGWRSFSDGNENGFRRGLVNLLSPYIPLLQYLLCEEKLEITDGVYLGGSDGYNTVIIPVLEGLGCPSDSIKSYNDYSKSGTGVVTDIIDPILALIDEIAESPVKSVCGKLPGIVYYINSLNIRQIVSDLVYPLNVLTEKLELRDILDISSLTGEIPSVDINSVLKETDLTSSLGITLPDIDLNTLASYGTAVTLASKRTDNGAATSYTSINGDAQAVLTVILRFLVKTIRMEENSGLLTNLMSSGDADEGGMDMVAQFAGNITAQFADMTDDEIIVWLYNLLFREKPKVETTAKDDFIPTIKYVESKKGSVTKITLIAAAVILFAGGLLLLLKKLGYFERY